MRSLMRGWRAPAALLACVLGAAAAEVAALYRLAPGLSFQKPEALAFLGRQTFIWVALLETGVVALLAPLLTAMSIGEERRRGTLEGLLLTRLTPRDILWGKLLAATGFLLVVILCLLPVQAVLFMFGGVSPWEILYLNLLVMAVALAGAAYGLFCSVRYFSPPVAVGNAIAGAISLLAPWQLVVLYSLRIRNLRRDQQYDPQMPTGCWAVYWVTGIIVCLFMSSCLLVPLALVTCLTPSGALFSLLFGEINPLHWDVPMDGLWWFITPLAILILLFLTWRICDTTATLLSWETSRYDDHVQPRRERYR